MSAAGRPADLAALKYYHGARIAGSSGELAIVSRTGYTGEDGFELIVPAVGARAVWETILAAGRQSGAMPAGLGARDTLRLEAAMPLYGHELSEAIDPFTAGLDFAVNLEDRNFPGPRCIGSNRKRAARARARRLGTGRQTRAARRLRDSPAAEARRRTIGEVTSGTFSPTLERPIAMGYVQADARRAGHGVGDRHSRPTEPARVVQLPFYRRPKSRMSLTSRQISYHTIATRRPSPVKPEQLRFAKTHEWVYVEPDSQAAEDRHGRHFGLRRRGTDRPGVHATAEVGRQVKAGQSFGEIESVKAVSDLYSPVDGEVVEVNTELPNQLETLSTDPYGAGWMVKIQLDDPAQVDDLHGLRHLSKAVRRRRTLA